jgi:hypothetical protein
MSKEEFSFQLTFEQEMNEAFCSSCNICPDCKGSGKEFNWEKGFGYVLCWTCNGDGKYPERGER